MIEIKGKVYRNLQEQVGKNAEDIADLINNEGYTKAESDAKYATKTELAEKANADSVYTKQQIDTTLNSYATKTELTNGLATKQDTLHLYDHTVRLELSSTEYDTLTAEVLINVINTNDANLNTYALLEEYVADDTYAVSGWVSNDGVRSTAYTISFYGSDELDVAVTNGNSATFDTIVYITDFKKQIL